MEFSKEDSMHKFKQYSWNDKVFYITVTVILSFFSLYYTPVFM